MVERGEQLGFALKPRKSIGIAGKRVRQDLDRDLALQPRIACAIHFSHSAAADQGDHFIRSETGAGGETH